EILLGDLITDDKDDDDNDDGDEDEDDDEHQSQDLGWRDTRNLLEGKPLFLGCKDVVSEDKLKFAVRTFGKNVEQIFIPFPSHCGKRVLLCPSLTMGQLAMNQRDT
ncbi:hypothetical protein P7K49_009391, partial [Saguinus oedipus]